MLSLSVEVHRICLLIEIPSCCHQGMMVAFTMSGTYVCGDASGSVQPHVSWVTIRGQVSRVRYHIVSLSLHSGLIMTHDSWWSNEYASAKELTNFSPPFLEKLLSGNQADHETSSNQR
jgi:hypothetical protein